jgi:branched-chain amino acid aminotransferase
VAENASRPSNPLEPPDRRIWLDGRLVPWAEATVHVMSHSHQRGSLIFDYMSVHETPRGPAVFRLREHMERFLASADLMGLPRPLDREALEQAVLATVRANPGAKSVKASAYLAAVEVDVVPMDERVSVAIAAYDPWEDVIRRNPGSYPVREVLRVWIEKDRRNRRADIVPPQAKVAANYASPMVAKWAARRAGYDEILLVDEEGFVAEGPTTNMFWVDAAGGLRTPPEDKVLLGVTRRSVIEIAKHDGIPCEETRVTPQELGDAAEVFLTGTTAGVWPVVSIDGQPVGDGVPGPVTSRLRQRFGQVVSGQDPDFDHWLVRVDEA